MNDNASPRMRMSRDVVAGQLRATAWPAEPMMEQVCFAVVAGHFFAPPAVP